MQHKMAVSKKILIRTCSTSLSNCMSILHRTYLTSHFDTLPAVWTNQPSLTTFLIDLVVRGAPDCLGIGTTLVLLYVKTLEKISDLIDIPL